MKVKFQEKDAMNSSSCFGVINTKNYVIQPVRVMQCCCSEMLIHFPGFAYFTSLKLFTSQPAFVYLTT